MHPKLIEYLLKLRAERIVYVSCNPSTCARDLDLLCHGGEVLYCIHPSAQSIFKSWICDFSRFSFARSDVITVLMRKAGTRWAVITVFAVVDLSVSLENAMLTLWSWCVPERARTASLPARERAASWYVSPYTSCRMRYCFGTQDLNAAVVRLKDRCLTRLTEVRPFRGRVWTLADRPDVLPVLQKCSPCGAEF